MKNRIGVRLRRQAWCRSPGEIRAGNPYAFTEVRIGEWAMRGLGFLAVGVGAAVGAWLRWWLGTALNPLFEAIPLGTLAANLIGAYVIGAAIALFAQATAISPEWRLLIITGFCGGLTTFSTFSGEITALFQQGRYAVMASSVAMHVVGSVAMTLFGMASWRWLAAR